MKVLSPLLVIFLGYTMSIQIILNEDDITGSCTETCEDMPTLHNEHGCTTLKDCKKSVGGWDRGFVRCDYCSCTCEKDEPERDVVVVSGKVSSDEDELYGTCRNTCDAWSGLVRSNFKGCSEVRDCKMEKDGWLKGFVMCDYCTCDCVNRKYAQQYILQDVKYDLSNAKVRPGKPIVIADTTVTNKASTDQTAQRAMEFEITEETSFHSSRKLETGLEVRVEAGVKLKDAFKLGMSVATTIIEGFEYTAGETKTETTSDRINADIRIAARSIQKVRVVGRRVQVDVPYTAMVVVVFPDGTTSPPEPTQGIFKNVAFAEFSVEYSQSVPLDNKNLEFTF